MQISFIIAVALATIILYLPGYLALRGFGFQRGFSVGVAPVAGITTVGLLAIIYSNFGIKSSPVNLILLPLFAAVCAYLMLLKKGKPNKDSENLATDCLTLKSIFLVALVGISIGVIVFVRSLPSLDALFQAWDYPHHLNEVVAFANSGDLSPIHGFAYAAGQSVDPFVETAGFYPSGWHLVCALVVMSHTVSVPLSINAVNFTFAFIVFPIAMWTLLAKMAPDIKPMPIIAAITSLSLVVFPWGLLTYGPLFPNLAGFSVLPGMIAAFMDVAEERRGSMLLIWAACCIGLFFLHPNVLFSMGIYLVPFVIHLIQTKGLSLHLGRVHIPAAFLSVMFALVCVALWAIAYNLPALAFTIAVVWRPYASVSQAIINLVTLSYVDGFPPSTAAQLFPAVILLLGLLSLCRNRDSSVRWMISPFAISAVLMVVAASFPGDSPIRHFLLGFWYTDPYRIAAMTTIFSIPILYKGVCLCIHKVDSLNVIWDKRRNMLLGSATILVGILYIGLTFYPSFQIAGLGKVNMAFTDIRINISNIYGYQVPLTDEEKDFLSEVKTTVGDDLVINEPYDGSVMAFGCNNINCYYRYFDGFGSASETDESKLVRQNLNTIASDTAVQAAVKSLGAKYVLVLDRSDIDRSFASAVYRADQWSGIHGVSDVTPGFSVVLREGDMRLYRIDAAMVG